MHDAVSVWALAYATEASQIDKPSAVHHIFMALNKTLKNFWKPVESAYRHQYRADYSSTLIQEGVIKNVERHPPFHSSLVYCLMHRFHAAHARYLLLRVQPQAGSVRKILIKHHYLQHQTAPRSVSAWTTTLTLHLTSRCGAISSHRWQTLYDCSWFISPPFSTNPDSNKSISDKLDVLRVQRIYREPWNKL